MLWRFLTRFAMDSKAGKKNLSNRFRKVPAMGFGDTLDPLDF